MESSTLEINGDTDMRFRSGLRYRSLGKFFEAALDRRSLSLEDVSSKTGLSRELLEDLISDRHRFDGTVVRKLKPIFPSTFRSLARWQEDIDKMDSKRIHKMSKIGSPAVRRFG